MLTETPIRALLIGAASAAILTACGQQATAPSEPTEAASPTEKPGDEIETADQLFDRIIEETSRDFFRVNPRDASYANLSDEDAGGRYKDRFETPGIAGLEERHAVELEVRRRLEALDPEALTPKRREMRTIMLAANPALDEAGAVADERGYYLTGWDNGPYNITQIHGVHIDLPQFMTQAHALQSADDVDAYITRLDLFYEVFAGEMEIFEANAAAGVLPPDYAVDGAIRSASGFIEGEPSANPMVTHLMDSIDGLEGVEADDVRSRALAAMETSVYPAYEALLEMLRRYENETTHDAGLWDLPGGDDLYAALVKVNGETPLSPGRVHELGLAEVDRIHNEMEALFEQIGITEGGVGERLGQLTADPSQVFPNTDEGREELLAYVRQLAAEADQVMADYFLVTPSIGVEVRRVPEYAEDGAPGGYYLQPAEDGSRPGLYFINLRDTATQPKFSLPTLTYHEAVPGHHFQLALAVDDKQTPLRVRQESSTNGFAEGWALYSESFAKEIGLYETDPYGDLGRLRDELFRAVRLVVDTGIHEKRWSREEAIDYMVANAGMEPSGVAIEIERYSVWPGQALGYKIGMLRIQALRSAAEEALGEDFDIGAFHYQVLRDGGAPLSVLEQRIEAWVSEGGPRPELN